MNKAFVSWSGGKDSCLSYCRALASGLKVCCLVNILTADGKYSCTHGLPASFLQAQSQAIGIPLVQLQTSGEKYEADFKKLLRNFKQKGIEGGVFGNGDVEHQWIDRVCREVGIIPHFPLDELSKDTILSEFITLGFEAIVVTTKADALGEEWLGRKMGLDFLKQLDELGKIKNITPGSKVGVYHTAVIDGPIFKKRLEIVSSERVLRDGYWFLNILDIEEKPSRLQLALASWLEMSVKSAMAK